MSKSNVVAFKQEETTSPSIENGTVHRVVDEIRTLSGKPLPKNYKGKTKHVKYNVYLSEQGKEYTLSECGKEIPLRQKSDKPRDYLTKEEVTTLVTQAKKGRHGHKVATMVQFAFRHGLRVSELVGMQWSDLDLSTARLHVRRAKGSLDGVHPVDGDELRALKRLKREADEKAISPFMFLSERGAPISEAGFRKTLNRLGKTCGFTWTISPHALRHSCGYHLANLGTDTRMIQEWLGHKSITSTVRYTQLASKRFDSLRSVW